MQNLYGVVSNDDGRYVMAAMRSNEPNVWKLAKYTEWESHNLLRRILLFHRGVYFGIKSWQKPRGSEINVDSTTIIEQDTSGALKDDGQRAFDIITNDTSLDIHREALSSNLLGIVSEDSFLTAMPLYMYEKAGDSFITIYGNGSYYSIGFTSQKKLLVSFKMAPGDKEKLPGHLGRIERYWNRKFPDMPFPDTIITMGDPEHTPDAAFNQKVHRIEDIPHDEHVLKAMGCALAQQNDLAPLFVKETPESSFRRKRTFMYGLSVGILFLGVGLLLFFSGMNIWFSNKKTAYENEYQKVIVNNQEIKKLLLRSNELAETITRLENTLSRQTIWGKFFHAIGKERPEGLYFERLGTEPLKDKEQVVRVAISGWTEKETNVTDFIAKLQDMPYVTQITLSSMERNKKKRSIFGFKVLCTLLLNEQ